MRAKLIFGVKSSQAGCFACYCQRRPRHNNPLRNTQCLKELRFIQIAKLSFALKLAFRLQAETGAVRDSLCRRPSTQKTRGPSLGPQTRRLSCVSGFE